MFERIRLRGTVSLTRWIWSSCLSLACVASSLAPACDAAEKRPEAPPKIMTPPSKPLSFCGSPGAVVFDENGKHFVSGAPPGTPDLAWLTLPTGFCAHHFAHVPVARQIRFAPGGELFVASPVTGTTGAGTNGLAAVLAVPDDDHDWTGEAPSTYLLNASSTQGLLFVPGWLYYQDGKKIRRRPYLSGDRSTANVDVGEVVAEITMHDSATHWPKVLDVADDGTLYVTNGGDQGELCDPARPTRGGVLVLDGTPGGHPIVKGMRNPIAMRCQRGKNRCYAIELSRDYSAMMGGREKLVPVRDGDDWGFPCCATKDIPYPDVTPVPDCKRVASENNSFVIGDTPFSLDFAPRTWPAGWAGHVVVALHGQFGSWTGAKLVAIATDPATGEPIPSGIVSADSNSGAVTSFATGWDDGTKAHGRPSDVTFAPDGRLFVANDVDGEIFWIAPVTDPVDASTGAGGAAPAP
jgi:glucose/arabinose dehydrogenase